MGMQFFCTIQTLPTVRMHTCGMHSTYSQGLILSLVIVSQNLNPITWTIFTITKRGHKCHLSEYINHNMPHRANISFPFLCYNEQLPEYCRLWMHCLVLHFQDGFPFPRCHDTGVRLSFVKTMLFCEQCNTSEMGKGKMEEKMWRQMWPDEEVK